MAEDDRLTDLHGPEAALLVIVEVGTANAPDRHFQANLTEAGLCHLPDFHLEVPPALQPCLTRFHHFTCLPDEAHLHRQPEHDLGNEGRLEEHTSEIQTSNRYTNHVYCW